MEPEQQAILEQFKELTAYSEDKHGQVMLLLHQTDWDLAAALGRYFDGSLPDLEHDRDPQQQLQQQLPLRSSPVNITGTITRRYHSAMPISSRWKFSPGIAATKSADWSLLWILMCIPNGIFYIVTQIATYLGLVAKPKGDPVPQTASIGGKTEYNIEDDLSHVLGEQKCKLALFKGEFNDAYQLSKQEHMFLLTILVNIPAPQSKDVHPKTLSFLQAINTDQFSSFVNSKNVLVYMGNVSQAEGNLVAKTYNVSTTPHMSLMANVSSSSSSLGQFSVIKRFDNISTSAAKVDKLIKRVSLVIESHDPQLVVLRSEKADRDLARIIREEQDQQYQQMLEQDKRLAKEREERELQAKIAKQEQEQLEKKKLMMIQQETERKNNCILHYIQKHLLNKGQSNTGCRIQFRKPNGQRIVYQFSPDQPIRDLFEYIEASTYLDDHFEGDLDNVDLSRAKSEDDAQFEFKFKFDLISPMPRLKLEPSSQCIKDTKCLYPNGSLLIENIPEDDDEDEGGEDEDEEDEDNENGSN